VEFADDFVAAWSKVMKPDRFDLRKVSAKSQNSGGQALSGGFF
jgi:hypothetical protein